MVSILSALTSATPKIVEEVANSQGETVEKEIEGRKMQVTVKGKYHKPLDAAKDIFTNKDGHNYEAIVKDVETGCVGNAKHAENREQAVQMALDDLKQQLHL